MPATPAASATPIVVAFTEVKPASADVADLEAPREQVEQVQHDREHAARQSGAAEAEDERRERPQGEPAPPSHQRDAGRGDRQRVGAHCHCADDQDLC